MYYYSSAVDSEGHGKLSVINDVLGQAITYPWLRTCPLLVVEETSSMKVSGSELPWQPARRELCQSLLSAREKLQLLQNVAKPHERIVMDVYMDMYYMKYTYIFNFENIIS